MRAPSDQEEFLLTNPIGRSQAVRVSVKDSGGTWRDLSSYIAGVDMLVSAKWNENVDSNGYVLDVEVRRNNEGFSLSPLQEDSAPNRGFNPLASYAPLLDSGREVKIEWQLLPLDTDPDPDGWNEGFTGEIDDVEFESDPLVIHCRDKIAQPMDTFIERERMYDIEAASGTTPDRGCLIWQRNTACLTDQLFVPTQANLKGWGFKVTTPGTTGDEEPTWPTSLGATVTSGTVTFTCTFEIDFDTGVALEETLQQLLNDNMSSPPTVFTPDSPLWQILPYVQSRTPTFTALRALVDQIGWDVRFKWDPDDEEYKLTLWCPDRAKTTPDRSFGEYDGPPVDGVKKISVSRTDVRNVIRVIVSDSSDKDPQGYPRRKVVEAVDSASITRYGRRFMEVAESSTSNLDTVTEATTLADRILSDLASPLADFQVEIPFFPFAELGDLYEFPANDRYFSSAQKFAVVAVAHDISKDRAVTTLDLRGKVSGGYERWLKRDVRAIGPSDVHAVNLITAAELEPVIAPVIGGTRVRYDFEPNAHRPDMEFEHHFSSDPDFVPDASTLQCVSKSRDIVVVDQNPGSTGYHRAIPVWKNAGRIVRGEPSAPTEVVHGRAYAGHLFSEVQWGRFPLNGGFETQFDEDSPPDHWEMQTGVWGTDMDLTESDSRSGRRSLELKPTGGNCLLSTGFFDVTGGTSYFLSIWFKILAGTGILRVRVRWYDENKETLGSDSRLRIDRDSAGDPGGWQSATVSGSAPTIARFGALEIDRFFHDATHNALVDSVKLSEDGSLSSSGVFVGEWHRVGDDSEPVYENDFGQIVGQQPLQFRLIGDECEIFGDIECTGDMPNDSDEDNDSSTVFTLPEDFRSPYRQRFIVSSYGLPGQVVVLPSGEVRVPLGQKERISINIRFPVGETPTLLDGLVAYWKLDGNGGDSSGNGHAMVPTGMTWSSGKLNTAASVFGGGDSSLLLNNDGIDLAGDLTISCWVNLDSGSYGDYRPILLQGFAAGAASDLNFQFMLENSGVLMMVGQGNYGRRSSFAPPANTWTHVVVTKKGGSPYTIEFWMDGVKDTGGSDSSYGPPVAPNPTGKPARIGCREDNYSVFLGLLDEMGLWNRILTDDEIADLYNGGAGLSHPF